MNNETSKIVQELVDDYGTKRAERLALGREVKKLEEEEARLFELTAGAMEAANLTVAGGKKYVVKRKVIDQPTVEDWGLFYAHVKDTGHFDLLHKRLGTTAVTDRWDDGKQVPGVGMIDKTKLTVGKA